ncbi:universal stress protein [Bradyrhizobium sp.]|uniref:universal stress protein n=1 Tax=Bradyrhizobium sp. TaxID=376 RepID=UPI002CF6DBFB|nr:universal stress protein [Bradyrhizobium sp.]HMM90348.1 universal stress protein [Bradyrhizobium sp.]
MSFANVMAYVDPQQQEEGHIRVAEAIAKRFDGSVIGVSAFAVKPPFVAEGVIIEETTPEDLRRMKADLAAKGDWFRKIVDMPSDKVEWRWGVEYPTAFLVTQARVADLVVVKRDQLKSDEYHYIDSATAMLRVGRPVLSVPERVTEISAEKIVVGWKDAREARLAVQQALPLLTRASRVTIVELCTSDQQDAARLRVRDVSRYLESHGASCQIDVRVHSAESDAHCLIRLAREEGADLIVAGGYGHSRLGEWMFGGMTRGLLQEAPICLMMSH